MGEKSGLGLEGEEEEMNSRSVEQHQEIHVKAPRSWWKGKGLKRICSSVLDLGLLRAVGGDGSRQLLPAGRR